MATNSACLASEPSLDPFRILAAVKNGIHPNRFSIRQIVDPIGKSTGQLTEVTMAPDVPPRLVLEKVNVVKQTRDEFLAKPLFLPLIKVESCKQISLGGGQNFYDHEIAARISRFACSQS